MWRDLVAEVFCGVGDPPPQLIDGRCKLRAAPLGLLSQFLNRSRHGHHRPIVLVRRRTHALLNRSFEALRGRALVGDGLRQLSAEEEDLGGIVGPEHQNDKRACRAIGRTRRCATEIDTDERLADGE